MGIKDSLLNSWSKPTLLTGLLKPFSQLYRGAFALRKSAYKKGVLGSYRAPVPVIIVGNLTVGGTGKTPMVIYLVEQLRARGLSPGVISRGYSGDAPHYPFEVLSDCEVKHSGDEPALIVKKTGVPMVVGSDRKASIQLLLENHDIDIVISDDGLQHLALQRDVEICILDDTSPQHNEHLLPAGPYREPLSRVMTVDFIVRHGGDVGNAENQFSMSLQPDAPTALIGSTERTFPLDKPIHAIAGIGNPQRFFDTCTQLGFEFEAHAFSDHHHFSAQDIDFTDATIIMTEKDAIKCVNFADERHWFLPVSAQLSEGLIDALMKKLNNNFRLQRVKPAD